MVAIAAMLPVMLLSPRRFEITRGIDWQAAPLFRFDVRADAKRLAGIPAYICQCAGLLGIFFGIGGMGDGYFFSSSALTPR